MVDLWEQETGLRISKNAIYVKKHREGLTTPRRDDLIPWHGIKEEHDQQTLIRYVRQVAQEVQGKKPYGDGTARRTALRWAREMREAGRVVAYDPDYGFFDFEGDPEGMWGIVCSCPDVRRHPGVKRPASAH